MRTVAFAGADLALYPNPTHGGATLIGASPGTVVQVLDALGRIVATAPTTASGNAQLPAGLPAGVYVVCTGAHALRLTIN